VSSVECRVLNVEWKMCLDLIDKERCRRRGRGGGGYGGRASRSKQTSGVESDSPKLRYQGIHFRPRSHHSRRIDGS
jgi:hypothetical protein